MEEGHGGGQLRRKRRRIGRKHRDHEVADFKENPLDADTPETLGLDFLCLASLIIERNIPILFPGSARPRTCYGMVGAGGSFLVFNDPRGVDDAIQPKEIRSLAGDKVVLKRTRSCHPFSRTGINEEATRYAVIMAELQILTSPAIESHENFIDFLGLTWDFEPTDQGKFSAWPVLGLEAAEFPMSSMEAHFSSGTRGPKIKLCHDVAKALEFLHACGIAHCDVKSENALICWYSGSNYVAKLSDFGSAVLDVTQETSLSHGIVGTRPWNAPEYSKHLKGLEVMKTDVFSYGMLLWRSIASGGILSRLQDAQNQDRDSIVQEIEGLKQTDKLLKAAIDDARHFCAESRDFEPMRSLLEKSLASNPSDRSSMLELESMLSELVPQMVEDNEGTGSEHYEEGSQATSTPEPHGEGVERSTSTLSDDYERVRPIPDVPFYCDDFDKIYELFEDEALPVKAQLIECLTRWATRKCQDFDTAEAAYQLSKCYFNGFGVECDSKTGLEWILRAAYSGSHKARSDAFRIYTAVAQSHAVEQVDRSEMINWLTEAVRLGSYPAARDLQNLDPAAHEEATRSWLRRFCNIEGDEGPAVPSQEELLHYCRNLVSSDALGQTSLNDRGHRPLHLASPLGYTAVAESLIERGASINAYNNEGETALLCACRAGQASMALWLLQRGAKAQGSNASASPLHWLIAIQDSDVERLARELVSRGAELEHQCELTESNEYVFDVYPHGTPLDWAVSRGHRTAVKVLVELGANPFNDCSQFSPFIRAVSLHDSPIVQLLLKSEYSTVDRVNEFDLQGQSLLFHAIYCNERYLRLLEHGVGFMDAARETIQLLLDFGCDPARVEKSGGTALHVAAGFCDLQFMQLLVGDLGMLKYINVACGERQTRPIHHAIASHRLDVLEFLIFQGADTFCRLSNGQTLLHLCAAVEEESHPIACLDLIGIRGRCDLDDLGEAAEYSEQGLTAFEMAVCSGNLELAKLFLVNGANPFSHPGREPGLLLLLINNPYWYSPQALQYLVENHPCPFIVQAEGQVSALHAAASLTSLGVLGDSFTSEWKFDFLLKKFPGPEQLDARTTTSSVSKTRGGQTPLHYAAKFGVYSAVWKLLEAGANVLAADDEGRQPLDLARSALNDMNERDLRQEMPHIYVELEDTVKVLDRAATSGGLLPNKRSHDTQDDFTKLTFSRLGFRTDS